MINCYLADTFIQSNLIRLRRGQSPHGAMRGEGPCSRAQHLCGFYCSYIKASTTNLLGPGHVPLALYIQPTQSYSRELSLNALPIAELTVTGFYGQFLLGLPSQIIFFALDSGCAVLQVRKEEVQVSLCNLLCLDRSRTHSGTSVDHMMFSGPDLSAELLPMRLSCSLIPWRI